jgi:hypothetical protein
VPASPPTFTFTGERFYDTFAPFHDMDAVQGYPLAYFCAAMAVPFDPVAELTRDQDDGTPGWAILFDPYACPEPLLPWLAQWEGVEIPPGLDTDEVRALIDEAPAQQRGTPEAIVSTAQRYLTGSRRVIMRERYPADDAGALYLRTVTSETPDAALVEQVLQKRQIPAGIVLDYATVDGSTYGIMEADFATYGAAEAAFATYGAAEEG